MAYADTFTSVGILLNLSRTHVDFTAFVDPLEDVRSLQTWAMAFLERWSQSNALAAKYFSLLRQCEEQLKSKQNVSETENSRNEAIFGSIPHESFNDLTSFPEHSNPFVWTSDASALDVTAWGFDGDFWTV